MIEWMAAAVCHPAGRSGRPMHSELFVLERNSVLTVRIDERSSIIRGTASLHTCDGCASACLGRSASTGQDCHTKWKVRIDKRTKKTWSEGYVSWLEPMDSGLRFGTKSASQGPSRSSPRSKVSHLASSAPQNTLKKNDRLSSRSFGIWKHVASGFFSFTKSTAIQHDSRICRKYRVVTHLRFRSQQDYDGLMDGSMDGNDFTRQHQNRWRIARTMGPDSTQFYAD